MTRKLFLLLVIGLFVAAVPAWVLAAGDASSGMGTSGTGSSSGSMSAPESSGSGSMTYPGTTGSGSTSDPTGTGGVPSGTMGQGAGDNAYRSTPDPGMSPSSPSSTQPGGSGTMSPGGTTK